MRVLLDIVLVIMSPLYSQTSDTQTATCHPTARQGEAEQENTRLGSLRDNTGLAWPGSWILMEGPGTPGSREILNTNTSQFVSHVQ